jgi:hypothetical protein
MIDDNALEERRTFSRLFYAWSLDDALRESREDFALLRQIQCRNAWRFIEYIVNLSPADVDLLVAALVARRHARELPELQSQISQRQDLLMRGYLQPVALTLSKRQIELFKNVDSGASKLADRKVLGRSARGVVTKMFGREPESWGGGNYRWAATAGRYTVHTYLDCGARSRQLAYSHSVCVNGSDLRQLENSSFLSWMGVSGMTMWEFVEEDGIQRCLELLREFIDRFLKAVSAVSSKI